MFIYNINKAKRNSKYDEICFAYAIRNYILRKI